MRKTRDSLRPSRRSRCTTRPFSENRRIHFCVSRSSPELRQLRIEPLESRMLLSVIHWDGGPTGLGTSWQLAENWENDVLPAQGDDVVIDIPTGGTIVYGSGNSTIKSLVSAGAFTLSGGALTVSGTVEVDNVFTISGGTLSQATVLRGSGGQSIIFTKGAADAGATLDGVTTSADLDLASNGGANVSVVNDLTLNNATVYLGNADGSTYGQMYFKDTETLGGAGTVLFGKQGDNNGLMIRDAATLTIGPYIKVRGNNGALSNWWGESGTIINEGTIDADGTGGTIYINPSTFQNKGKLIASGETLTIVGLQHLGGVVEVKSQVRMDVTESLTIDGGGTFNIGSGATFNFQGDLTVNGTGALPLINGGQWYVTGNLRGDTTNADAFAQAPVIFWGQGTASFPQLLEVMSQDRGNKSTGFEHNFAYGNLLISNATYVQLVDQARNASASETNPEAVYVEALSVAAGCTLDLNGFHVYARSAQINGKVRNGEILTLLPDLTVAATHTGDFMQGQTGATFTINVTNNGAEPTSGIVNVTDLLPAGLTATAMSGDGWTTDLTNMTATRSDALAASASYAPLTVTVNVAADAPASVINTVQVSGGNDSNTGNNTANDTISIVPASLPSQKVSASPDFRYIRLGQSFGFTVQYNTSNNDNMLTGFGIRMHFNSAVLQFDGFYDVLSTGLLDVQSQPMPDPDTDGGYDGNTSTDMYVLIEWSDLKGEWPNVNLPVKLFEPKFTLASSADVRTYTSINFSACSTKPGYQFYGNPVTVVAAPVNLDVNGDGVITDEGDGKPIMKYMFDPQTPYKKLLDQAKTFSPNVLNPDGSSGSDDIPGLTTVGDALNDGILIRRYIVGAPATTDDALHPGDTATWQKICDFLDKFNPMVPTGEPFQFTVTDDSLPEPNSLVPDVPTTTREAENLPNIPAIPESTQTVEEGNGRLPSSDVVSTDPVVQESPKMLAEVASSENEIPPQAAVSKTAGHQIVTPDPITQTVVPGNPVTLHVRYTTDPVDASLTGLGLRIHYNSQLVIFDKLSDVFGTNLVQEQPPVADREDFDHDPTTDKYLLISWADVVSNWPGEIPITLLTAHWDSSPQAKNSTVVNFTSSSTAAGWDFEATPAVIHFQQIIANSNISGYVLAENGDPRFKPAEMGLPGVTVVLTSTTSAGTLKVTTMTDDNGAFRFSNLPPGLYQITETHPAAVLAGATDNLAVTLGSNDNRQGVVFHDGWFKPQYVSVRNFVSNRPLLGAPGSAAECRNLIARGEELAGNIAQAALIRQGGANTNTIFTPAPVKEQVKPVAKTDQATAKTSNITQITAAASVAIKKNSVELSTANASPFVTAPHQNVILVGAQQNPPLSNNIASTAAAIQVASYSTGNAVPSSRIPIARPMIIEPAIVIKTQPNVSQVFANETVMSVVPAARVETTVKQNSTTVAAAISTAKPEAHLASITKTSQSLDKAIHGLFYRVGKSTTESGILEGWAGNRKKALYDLAKDDHSQHVSRPAILQFQNDEDKLDLATDFEFAESIANNCARDKRPIKSSVKSLFETADNWLDI